MANAALAALPASATTTTAAEVLAAFDGNYAVLGPTAAADDDDRGGIEVPHAVRWLPTADAAGRSAARAAALEHVAARCTQLAEAPDASEGVKAAQHVLNEDSPQRLWRAAADARVCKLVHCREPQVSGADEKVAHAYHPARVLTRLPR